MNDTIDDTFKVGPTAASFMGKDTQEVNAILTEAEKFRSAKAEIISEFEAVISSAAERAKRRHAELCAVTQGKIAGLK